MSRASAALQILVTLGLATALVATALPINLAALGIWAILVEGWVKRRARASGGRAGVIELVVQLSTMSVLVLAAAFAPGKVVDQMKARQITLPRQSMTIGELQDPQPYQQPHPFRYGISAPGNLADRVVRFPARELSVGEFMAAIEGQTPLRHRFGHCGNEWTILWGGDCSFGLSFRLPPR
ncbi:hypothetical protein P12x_005845 [Tundrisphaera lichenicola]|uniref:hypothetical protein n=1 Tax=Tundrisphaera lichenicola TaxID=2029860 RepID=UPI003EBD1BFD